MKPVTAYYDMSIKKTAKADLPVFLMFCIFPFISLYTWQTGKGEVNYDYFWVPCFVWLFFYKLTHPKAQIKKSHKKILSILLTLVCLKYAVPWTYEWDLSLKASLMDGKWVIYVLLAIIWTDTFGLPSIEKLYKAGVFFSVIYIAKALYSISTGQLSRSGVLLEANYDGFMILIVYCFHHQVKNKKKWHDWVLISATVLTFSRTGILSLFAVWSFMATKKNIFLLIPIIPVMVAMTYFGISMRGTNTIEHLDRFILWEQAISFFKETDLTDWLLGNTPGKSLSMTVNPEFNWYITTFEEMRNLKGVFPFMFHSAYIRLAITWGVPCAVLLTVFLIKRAMQSRNEAMKMLCIITLVQSFSLSTMTLPNVSLLLFTAFLMATKEKGKSHQRQIKTANTLSM